MIIFELSQRKLQGYAEKYAADQEAFFKDYAESHAKLSNAGAKFDPPEVCYNSSEEIIFRCCIFAPLRTP